VSAFVLDSDQRAWISGLMERCRRMHTHPRESSPMIIIDVASNGLPSWKERLAEPRIMMEAQLEEMRPHLALRDDCIPTLRVEFGTGQVAAAFGCEIVHPDNSYPAVGSNAVKNAEDAFRLDAPSLDAGMYPRLAEYTHYFREHMPGGMRIQPPDLQSPFNCAHLIRGNDILTDFIDNPRAVDALLDVVTDYLVALVPHLRAMVDAEDGWFLDYGALWKGGARISNCTMQLISPDFYRGHVLARDRRLFQHIGGGRIHYCGTNTQVVDDFLSIPRCNGFDFMGGMEYDEVWKLAAKAPAGTVIMENVDAGTTAMERLLAGDWPAKRNIIIKSHCASLEEGRDLLGRLRAASSRN
jgi:uroporphyrinogen-III decarboxylase